MTVSAPKRDGVLAVLLPLAVLAAIVAVWHAAVAWTGTRVFPSPGDVGRALGRLAGDGSLGRYAGDSLRRVASGYGLALLAGIPLGLWMGTQRAAAAALNPVAQVIRPISPLAWIPVAIVLFGVGDGAAIFLIFLASLFPIALATQAGVQGVEPILLAAGRNFGLPRAALWRRVILPAALPRILAGLRIALGIAWLVVVAAEMLAVDSGLGYLVIDSRNAGKRYDLVLAAIVTIGAIGLALDLVARGLERLRPVRWGFLNR
jgi:NitT/TauT family transport system permease protein